MSDFGEQDLVDQGAIPPKDFHDAIDRTREVARFDLDIPVDLRTRLEHKTSGLLFDDALLTDAAAALAVGHLVLQGPPGTGKSTLARILCDAFGVEVVPVTAHEDWSTFELIGRHELRVGPDGKESIVGVNGHFSEAAIRCAGSVARHLDNPAEPQATWLLIDELNRSHADRAFGELFSVLGTDDPVEISLPHQPIGNNLLVSPRRFRIIATINSIDKQSVNSLSQGLRRRFTFLTVDIPPRRSPGTPWVLNSGGDSPALREMEIAATVAATRVARRLARPGSRPGVGNSVEDLKQLLSSDAFPHLCALFDFCEVTRYADHASELPYVPIGTAPIIDTLELCLSRIVLGGRSVASMNSAIDWAVSVKLVPLFDADSVNRARIQAMVEILPELLRSQTARALSIVSSDGLHFVGD